MTSGFENSQTHAYTTGFAAGVAVGHTRGMQQGREVGYAEGQLAGVEKAVFKASRVLNRKNEQLHVLRRQVGQLGERNEGLAQEVHRLREQMTRLQHDVQALQEQQFQLQQAFLGLVAMAEPVLAMVPHWPLKDRVRLINRYGENAIRLLTQDHVANHRFPHHQPLIRQHLPQVCEAFDATVGQVSEHIALAPVATETASEAPVPNMPPAG